MKTYEINIKGSGTREEIRNALLKLTDALQHKELELHQTEWEDETLHTTINDLETNPPYRVTDLADKLTIPQIKALTGLDWETLYRMAQADQYIHLNAEEAQKYGL